MFALGAPCHQMNTMMIPLDITPLDVSISSCGSVKVLWPGDPPHVSFYDPKWLVDHYGGTPLPLSKRDPAVAKDNRVLFDSTTFVSGEGPPKFPVVPHDEFMRDDATVLKMLKMVSAPACSPPPVVPHGRVTPVARVGICLHVSACVACDGGAASVERDLDGEVTAA